jgi:hypothetical protein
MAGLEAIPQPGDVFAGKYLIDRVIGGGDSSIVFGARHRVTRKPVAIRWYAPSDASELTLHDSGALTEHEIVGHFRHPNTLEVFDTGEHAGSHYAVIEWLDGESLNERLQRGGPLPLTDACRLLIPCMRGLHEAHVAGIVHRELKPACIFICWATQISPETVKVLDFEINQRSVISVSDSGAVTQPAATSSNLAYRAPEQIRGRAADLRADVYAFGAILYETLSGQAPASNSLNGRLLSETAHARSNAKPLPPAAHWVIRRAMSREASERFQTLSEFADALEELCGSAPQAGTAPGATLKFGAVAAATPGSGPGTERFGAVRRSTGGSAPGAARFGAARRSTPVYGSGTTERFGATRHSTPVYGSGTTEHFGAIARSTGDSGPGTERPDAAVADSTRLPPSLPSQRTPAPHDGRNVQDVFTAPPAAAFAPRLRPRRRIGPALYIAAGVALLAGAFLLMDQFAVTGDDEVVASFSAVGKYSPTMPSEPAPIPAAPAVASDPVALEPPSAQPSAADAPSAPEAVPPADSDAPASSAPADPPLTAARDGRRRVASARDLDESPLTAARDGRRRATAPARNPEDLPLTAASEASWRAAVPARNVDDPPPSAAKDVRSSPTTNSDGSPLTAATDVSPRRRPSASHPAPSLHESPRSRAAAAHSSSGSGDARAPAAFPRIHSAPKAAASPAPHPESGKPPALDEMNLM